MTNLSIALINCVGDRLFCAYKIRLNLECGEKLSSRHSSQSILIVIWTNHPVKPNASEKKLSRRLFGTPV